MSSTIDRVRALLRGPRRRHRSAERGQVLVIFAFGAIGILAVAALVFDVGQNLFERRKQQDAADASALAGARWMTTTVCKTRSNLANCPEAASAAMALANQHGYPASQVTINIPPTSGNFSGWPGKIQVSIKSNRNSYFAGVVGIRSFGIAATAVASNVKNLPFPYSILSLNSSGCKSGWAHGNGLLTVHAEDAEGVVKRLMQLASEAPETVNMPERTLQDYVASAFQCVVFLKRVRQPDGSIKRFVTEIAELNGFVQNGRINQQSLFKWKDGALAWTHNWPDGRIKTRILGAGFSETHIEAALTGRAQLWREV